MRVLERRARSERLYLWGLPIAGVIFMAILAVYNRGDAPSPFHPATRNMPTLPLPEDLVRKIKDQAVSAAFEHHP